MAKYNSVAYICLVTTKRLLRSDRHWQPTLNSYAPGKWELTNLCLNVSGRNKADITATCVCSEFISFKYKELRAKIWIVV